MPPRDWQSVVEGMTNVQRLVHLAMRRDPIDEENIRVELLRSRRLAYENELELQARRVGCPNRKANLRNNPILSGLNFDSVEDARSIVNTYNYDLAIAILHIGAEYPTANRYTYAKHLQTWETERSRWKNPQIVQHTTGSARSKAQQDFYDHNGAMGTAVLWPKEAVCPICIGWIERGEVPLRVAQNNPPPYHPNCPHLWSTNPDKVAKEDCPLLWMGE